MSDEPRLLPPAAEWGACWTRARSEKVVKSFFDERNVPAYLPTVTKRRVYGSRIRHSELPLFPGYVFFDLEAIPHPEVYSTRKVAQVLEPTNPERLRSDLQQIARALHQEVHLEQTKLDRPGTPVEVIAGPLQGTRGELVQRASKTRLVIRVDFIGRAAELEIDEGLVVPLDSSRDGVALSG